MPNQLMACLVYTILLNLVCKEHAHQPSNPCLERAIKEVI